MTEHRASTSTTYGFCPPHGADIPLVSGRWCEEHRAICLPPSWASQDLAWPEWPPRPEGYVWAPRQLQEGKRAPAKPRKPFATREEAVIAQDLTTLVTCMGCGATFESLARRDRQRSATPRQRSG